MYKLLVLMSIMCKMYHAEYYFRRPRGMYFCPADKGEMASMVYNWESNEVDAVVVTDGSRLIDYSVHHHMNI